jgi:hypothetical protein
MSVKEKNDEISLFMTLEPFIVKRLLLSKQGQFFFFVKRKQFHFIATRKKNCAFRYFPCFFLFNEMVFIFLSVTIL